MRKVRPSCGFCTVDKTKFWVVAVECKMHVDDLLRVVIREIWHGMICLMRKLKGPRSLDGLQLNYLNVFSCVLRLS